MMLEHGKDPASVDFFKTNCIVRLDPNYLQLIDGGDISWMT